MSEPGLNTSWCAAFDFLKDREFTPDGTQSVFANGSCWCRLCQQQVAVRMSERQAHVDQHKQEFEAFKEGRRKQAQEKSTKRLRQMSQDKREGNMPTQTQTKQPKVTAKEQGFPGVYLSPNGNFKLGGDSQAKSDLIGIVLGLPGHKPRAKMTKEQAQGLIEARGWGGYLDRKRKIVEAAQAKAQRQRDAAVEAEANKDK
ncbi:MAG: hypothetical protein KGL39_37700 [Patescibacteria group bacterium]|nr:hypothetical protein [Patescibacteria group bacterium]